MRCIVRLATVGLLTTLSISLCDVLDLRAKAQTNPTPILTADLPYLPENAYDEYMRLGFDAEQAGDYAAAATYFRYALFANPQDREATTAYWNMRSQLRSEDLSARAITYNTNMEAGYDATEAEDYELALQYFNAALAQRPSDYYATQAIRNVQTYLTRGVQASSPSDVAQTYTAYVNEPLYDRYMRLGYAAVQREDFRTAQEYFRSALYDRPNDRQATIAYWNVVDALKGGELSSNESVESAYDRYMRRGYDATERGNYPQAIQAFENALVERPGDGYAIQAIRNLRTYID
ncbi:tetratricopeptide repeat domain protein [Synechococcus sp. PCC 7335]|uniref:tetratricopeptide repeat protein n=1 Tax=Synechococcus sp. (strain ATCC 29403 / PCC 7335) TaxID=91464 RepID=UPI00017EB53A|nr:tetratricopeptide repeat protein [Synechococcus sp. PCC 7335]EDX83394.1 tetratricopeptide repeat domain protein [Synechococcus sp. PCC 7335]